MKQLLLTISLVLSAVLVPTQFPMQGAVGYLLSTTDATPAYSNYYAKGGQVRIVPDDDDQDVTIVFARDYLKDGDFEEDPRRGQGSGAASGYLEHLSPYSRDQWDSDGALNRDWNQTEGAGGSIEVTQTQLFGEDSLLFDASGGTAVVEIGTNTDITTDLTGWTTDVNGGDGSVAASSTTPHTAGGQKVIITGGSAHVDFEQAVTVVASTRYFLTFWWTEGASNDVCDFRLQESTGGTDWLESGSTAYASAWNGSEQDVLTTDSQDISSAFVHNVVTFVTQASITGIRISFSCDVTGDIIDVDDISMALVPATEISTATLFSVFDTTADSYAIVANHTDGGTDSILQVQLLDAGTCVGDNTCLYWDGTSDWTATQTWINLANVGTTSTQGIETFLAHDAAHTADHRIRVKFRALMGTSEDITLDNVFLVETTTHSTEGLMILPLVNVDANLTEYILLDPNVKGRFVFDATGAIGLSFFGQFYGGS